MLKSAHDEALFEYYMTSQLAVVNATTLVHTPVGKPAMIGGSSVSPNGQFLLVEKVKRPFSRLVPWRDFPQDVEVWNRRGEKVRTIADVPMGDTVPINGVLTGPNEGGKSTMLKALTLCLQLAQTTGIAPAAAMTFTPFHSIDTYLNITDDIGAGNSLFKAEVLRTQQLIDRVATATPGQFNFDEIFNGTSPVEGTAAAYSVAKHLGQFPNSMCMVPTHFPLLTQLETETTTFCNYKVSVNQFRDGSIGYPYKLEHGISNQHVALDILRNQGFDSNLVEEARSIVLDKKSPRG